MIKDNFVIHLVAYIRYAVMIKKLFDVIINVIFDLYEELKTC